MSWVPLPWCASQSTISTRSPRSRSAAAVTATLFSRQKPIARSATAWWPGGRTAQNAASPSPRSSASTASSPLPAARQRGLPRRGRRAGVGVEVPAARRHRTARGRRGTRRCAPARARPGSRAGARAGAGRRAARRRRARRAPPARAPAARDGRDRRRAPRSGRRSRPGARCEANEPAAWARPWAAPVATLAAGEGAPGAVVPISRRRRPGRGVARPDRRRIARVARSRRALAPNAATGCSNGCRRPDTAKW